MSHTLALHRVVGLFEHALAVVVGFIMMVVGLALGVTIMMLPVGLVIGLIGFALFVTGLLVAIGRKQGSS